MTDLRAYAREAAQRAGIDPERFVRQIQQESRFDPDAHNDASGADGIAQIVIRWHPAMAGKTRDPKASLDYAAALMLGHLAYWQGRGYAIDYAWALALSSYNAGRQATIDGLAGKLDGWPYGETIRYLSIILQISESEARRRLTGKAAMPKLTYNPDAPVDIQDNDWSCSEQAAQWLLRAIGRDPKDAWIRGQLLDRGFVTVAHGLMDATGANLAGWLQEQYGDEMGLRFTSKNGASWEDIAALAGKQPVMIGGRSWNHWSGVRRLKDGGLELANPSPSWKDTGTLLDRAEFDRWGSWSYITVSDAAGVPAPIPAPAPADEKDAIIAQLRAELAAEREKTSGLVTAVAVLGDDVGDALQAQVDKMREIRTQFVGPRR